MLSLLQQFSRISVRQTSFAGPSNLAREARSLSRTVQVPRLPSFTWSNQTSSRNAAQLAPRRTKYRKAHKGRVPLHTGGSLKGTTLCEGSYGIRLLEPARLSAKQLQSAETALKRKLKVIKGAQVFMRVFPDIAVCVKGNETRMGKGKGSFEFWACRATIGRVIFEIGGPVEIRPEVAKEALRLASAKLPVRSEFITRESAPRLGRLVETSIPPGSASARGGAGIVSPETRSPTETPAST